MNKFGFLILTITVFMISWVAGYAQQVDTTRFRADASGSPELEKAARRRSCPRFRCYARR